MVTSSNRGYLGPYPTTEQSPCNTLCNVCEDNLPKVLMMLLSERVKTLSNLIQHSLGSIPSVMLAEST